jgi:hypothetical protein
VYANTAPQTDTIYRPTPEGAAIVLNLRGSAAPSTFRWNVGLEPGERIEKLSDGGLAIVDTTVEDIACDVPPEPEGDNTFAALADAELQRAQSERDVCLADSEVDDGAVAAVIAPPVAVDEAGNPVPVTIEAVQIPDVEPYVEIDVPNYVPVKKVKLKASARHLQAGGYGCQVGGPSRPAILPSGKLFSYGNAVCRGVPPYLGAREVRFKVCIEHRRSIGPVTLDWPDDDCEKVEAPPATPLHLFEGVDENCDDHTYRASNKATIDLPPSHYNKLGLDVNVIYKSFTKDC